MSWTDERIERLKAMWTKGATASQIADELGGVSRNAVIGKAHRLGLEARPSPVKPGGEKEAAETPATYCPARPPAGPGKPADAGFQHAIPLGRSRRLHPPGSRRHAGADPAGSAAPPG